MTEDKMKGRKKRIILKIKIKNKELAKPLISKSS